MEAVVKKNQYVLKHNGSTWGKFLLLVSPNFSPNPCFFSIYFPRRQSSLSQPSHLLHLITYTKSMHFNLHQVKCSVSNEKHHQLTVILSVPLVLAKRADSASSEEDEEKSPLRRVKVRGTVISLR